MSQPRLQKTDPRMQEALAGLQLQIESRYPDVGFVVVEGEDPEGVYLKTCVDIDDLDEVLDQDLLDRLFEVQVEQGLPIYVVPIWPLERVHKELARRKVPLSLIPSIQ